LTVAPLPAARPLPPNILHRHQNLSSDVGVAHQICPPRSTIAAWVRQLGMPFSCSPLSARGPQKQPEITKLTNSLAVGGRGARSHCYEIPAGRIPRPAHTVTARKPMNSPEITVHGATLIRACAKASVATVASAYRHINTRSHCRDTESWRFPTDGRSSDLASPGPAARTLAGR
jgi:hypothetical protein